MSLINVYLDHASYAPSPVIPAQPPRRDSFRQPPMNPYRSNRRGPSQSLPQPRQTPEFSPWLEPPSGWASPQPLLASVMRESLFGTIKPVEPVPAPRKDTRKFLAAAVPGLTCLGQLSMLVYLLQVFLSLPMNHGERTRVSPWYSIWPYISCVGSIVPKAFRTFLVLYALQFVGMFALDLYLSKGCQHRYALRWLRLAAAAVDSALIIAIGFMSLDDRSHAHLYVVSVRSMSSISVKTLSYYIDHLQRKRYSRLRTDCVMLVSKRWKFGVCCFAVPLAVMASIGVYACHKPADIRQPGTTCYVLAAMSAIADWLYSLTTIAFNASLAYDFYHAERFARLRLESLEANRAQVMSDMKRLWPYADIEV